jgi:hypothetical protein
MSFGIPVNSATAAMEIIYERLCWIYTTVQNTFVYDQGESRSSSLRKLARARQSVRKQVAPRFKNGQSLKRQMFKTLAG